jgi:hypothetical protein
MKRFWASLAALGIAALAIASGFGRSAIANASDGATKRDVVRFQTMFGDHAPFIGSAGAVRGVPAAPLPWMIGSVQGHLNKDGELVIDVDGLVLANDPSVPPSLRGTNPVPFFAAVVSCQTDSNGVVATDNLMTTNFPASMPGGNAHIDQKLTLSHPCVAPVVFVTAPNGSPWFAVTGG